MRSINLTILVMVLCSAVHANDRIYKKLNQLYLSDSELCLSKAKKYIAKKPMEATPHFFASSIYLDKVSKSLNARGRYLQLRRSISSAQKFDKLSDSELKEKVNWTDKLDALSTKTAEIVHELDKAQCEDLSQELIKGMNGIETYVESQHPEMARESENMSTKKDAIEEEEEEQEEITIEVTKDATQLFGMPEGTERIPSANAKSEKELLDLINVARTKKGLPTLTWNEDLAKACRYHAYDLGSQAYFDHNTYDRKNGKLVPVGATFERIRKFYNQSAITSENIAAGNESPNKTYVQWYNSDGHNKNLFNSESKYAGIGFVQVPGSPHEYYWVYCTAE